MFNEAARLLGTNRSCIRELFAYGNARAAQIGRENVYDYSLGNPSIPAPPEIQQTIFEILQDTPSLQVHGYTAAVGDLETRHAIARDLEGRYGVAVDPRRLFLTCGAAPALCAVFGALAVPNGEILGIAPYFPEYQPFVQAAGLTFRAVPPDIPAFQIRFDALESMLSPNTCALILNSPNNPSGTVYSRKTLLKLKEILDAAARRFGHPIYIISDEPYRELVYDGISVPFLPEIYKDTILCYSYSKSLSLPGERIGYVYVSPEAADSADIYAAVTGTARASGHVCAPALWQKVIARCTHLRPDLMAYDRNRQLLYEGLLAAGYSAPRPQGAFYLFVEAPGGDAAAFSEEAKKRDLLVVPGDGFGCPGYFRLCYCVEEAMIRRSLPIFASLAAKFGTDCAEQE